MLGRRDQSSESTGTPKSHSSSVSVFETVERPFAARSSTWIRRMCSIIDPGHEFGLACCDDDRAAQRLAEHLVAGALGVRRARQQPEQPERVVRLPGRAALPMPGLQRVSRRAAEVPAVDTHLRVSAVIDQVPASGGLEEALTGLVQERVAQARGIHPGRDAVPGGPGGEPGQPSGRGRATPFLRSGRTMCVSTRSSIRALGAASVLSARAMTSRTGGAPRGDAGAARLRAATL